MPDIVFLCRVGKYVRGCIAPKSHDNNLLLVLPNDDVTPSDELLNGFIKRIIKKGQKMRLSITWCSRVNGKLLMCIAPDLPKFSSSLFPEVASTPRPISWLLLLLRASQSCLEFSHQRIVAFLVPDPTTLQ